MVDERCCGVAIDDDRQRRRNSTTSDVRQTESTSSASFYTRTNFDDRKSEKQIRNCTKRKQVQFRLENNVEYPAYLHQVRHKEHWHHDKEKWSTVRKSNSKIRIDSGLRLSFHKMRNSLKVTSTFMNSMQLLMLTIFLLLFSSLSLSAKPMHLMVQDQKQQPNGKSLPLTVHRRRGILLAKAQQMNDGEKERKQESFEFDLRVRFHISHVRVSFHILWIVTNVFDRFLEFYF